MSAGDQDYRIYTFDITHELDDIRRRLQSLEARILSLGQTRAEWELAQRKAVKSGEFVKGCER